MASKRKSTERKPGRPKKVNIEINNNQRDDNEQLPNRNNSDHQAFISGLGRGNEEEDRRRNQEEEDRRRNQKRRNYEEDRRRNQEKDEEESERSGNSDDGNEIPGQFRSCSSTLEICNWLVNKRPDIINLAFQMLKAKKPLLLLPSNSGSKSTQQLLSSNSSSKSIQQDTFRLLDESMKCLFLRVRDPSVESLDNFVVMITGEDLYSNTSQEFLDRIRKSFTDYRNKFNDSIQKLILDFKNSNMNRGNSIPSEDEVKETITEEIVKKVLSRQFAAVNQQALKQIGSLEKIIEFVQESFKVSWKGKDLNAIKSLDYMTKDLNIPSRSGKNICNKLTIIH